MNIIINSNNTLKFLILYKTTKFKFNNIKKKKNKIIELEIMK